MLPDPLIPLLREHFALEWRGIHGAPHWARVRRIGLRLAADTGASLEIVELFAFLHDSCRLADEGDPVHGARAAAFVADINDRVLGLAPSALTQLMTACEGHSRGRSHDDPTIATCWDADRLDLARIGIRPNPHLLCTQPARDPDVIAWAVSLSASSRV